MNEELHLKEDNHYYLKFNNILHFIWIFGILTLAYFKFCPNNICSDDIINVIVLSFIPGTFYIIFSLMTNHIIYQDKDYKDKFNTNFVSKLKLYSLFLIILSIILNITNYSINYFYYVPSVLFELINYLKLKKEYKQNYDIEEKIKNGSIDKYIEKDNK